MSTNQPYHERDPNARVNSVDECETDAEADNLIESDVIARTCSQGR